MIIPDPGELQDLVRDLHQQATPWLPAGLASRLDWGAPLSQACTVLSAAGLHGILEHSPGDFVVRVAAGTPLLELQAELAGQGQWLAVDTPPLTPSDSAGGSGSRGGGSVGGLVARGLAGGYRQRYLGVRDQLIGITILRADGVMARAGGKVVKNVAGYDLMRLFTGSWGSLGLITEITLRTMPLPRHRAGLLLAGPHGALLALSQALLHAGANPERLDLWSAPLAAAAGLEPRPHLLVALSSLSPASLQEQSESLTAAAGADLEVRRCPAAELERLLAATRPAAPALGAPDPSAWLLRLGVSPSRLVELLQHPALAALPLDLAAGTGLGLAWAPAAAIDAEQVRQLRQRCRELGGELTVLRQPAGAEPLPAWEDAPASALIEAVKARFDPSLQLAPGRLPGVARPRLPQPAGR